MTALLDLSPTFQLLAIGAGIAALPIGFWAWRQRGQGPAGKLRALVAITLFLTFDLVLFGAFTRLTDSGLGCPDWPGCYGSATPLGAKAEILAAQTAMPDGPVTTSKAWIEMIHRKAATAIGALITLIMVLGFVWRASLVQSLGQFSPWWGVGVFVWVCAQGAFGALTVTLKLQPVIVTAHLLGGMGLLMVLAALLRAMSSEDLFCYENNINKVFKSAGKPQKIHRISLMTCLQISFALVWLQIALGGWVSTNYAVLACTDFPLCQGQIWPPMSLREGFELWRPLGQRADGTALSFTALVGIHYMHRLGACVVFAGVGYTAWRCWRHAKATPSPAHASTAKWLAALLVWQLATGLGNVLLGWPLLAAVSHTGGAAGLVVVLSLALAPLRQSSP